jgi:hypothetical protein
MGGGLLQLVALGAQDAYLNGNPQITFWKGLFKRHTNFAMEPFRLNLTGQPNWGVKQSVTLGRHADLAYSTYLEVVLPNAASSGSTTAVYNNEQFRLGYNLLKYVELEIGGQLIDRLYGEYLFLWDTLSQDLEKGLMLQRMVAGHGRPVQAGTVTLPGSTTIVLSDAGNNTQGQAIAFSSTGDGCAPNGTGRQSAPATLYIPLSFFYTRNPGCALPLIALQYHETKINIAWNDTAFVTGDYLRNPSPAAPTSASMYVDYIYLDVEERRRMAQEAHEYLIEQVQYNEDKGISSANNRIDLTFNHPVKELIWVVQPTAYRSCKVNLDTSSVGVRTPTINPRRLTPFTYDQNAIYEQRIQFNGQDRLDRRYGDYYNRVQPYQHHSGSPGTIYFDTQTPTPTASAPPSSGIRMTSQPGIYSYSFALKPEESQPSGTCNFSRIDTATIVMDIDGSVSIDETTDKTWGVRVYAINYNILRVMSGMAGLSYSN